MIQLGFLVAALSSSILVTIEKSDGQRVAGELTQLSSEAVAWRSDDLTAELSRADISRIDFPTSTGEPASSPFAFVRFVDGSLVPCESVAVAAGRLELRSAYQTSLTAPDATIRAIRWPLAGEATDATWNEILASSQADDSLVLRREKSLDYLPGVVVGISASTVQFEFRGSMVNVPLAKAAGVIFARKANEWPAARVRLTTHDGGLWMLETVALRGDRLSFRSVSGVDSELPISAIRQLEYPQLDAVFLSDLQPYSAEFSPFWGSQPKLEKYLAQMYGPRSDVSFEGAPLRIRDATTPSGWRDFRRGLAVHSRTELVYRLANNYRRFRTTVGFDPSAAAQANVQLSVMADDEPLFVKQLDAADEPTLVEVDVTGVNRLKLLVDFGQHMDIGDRLHLGDARLTK